MNLDQLKNYDSTLEQLISSPKGFESIHTLCDMNFLSESGLTFITNDQYLKRFLAQENAPRVHVIINEKLKEKASLLKDRVLSLWTSKNAPVAMAKISAPFYEQKVRTINSWHDGRQSGSASVDPSAYVAQGVFLGENVSIGANVRLHAGVVITGHCTIGENTEIFPNVTIYPFVNIGSNVRIHAGSAIGADGFGYNFEAGIHHKIWHFGGVHIGDSVEIGANSCVDGGTFSATQIGAGSKLDNHVQIGHNCRLGNGVIVCGHVAIGGSTSLGDFTVVGGKAGFGDGLTLGKACQVAGGALVNCDWPDGSVVAGHPARPVKEWLKGVAWLRKESLKGSR